MKHKWKIITEEFEPEWNERLMKETTPPKEYTVVRELSWIQQHAAFFFIEGIFTFSFIMTWLQGGFDIEGYSTYHQILLSIGLFAVFSVLTYIFAAVAQDKYEYDGTYTSLDKANIKKDYLNSKEE